MDNPPAISIFQVMNYDSDILIVGGGLAGPTLALALARSGFSVTVIDALEEKIRRNAAFDGRSYAVALTSCRLLQGVGLWPALADDAQPILDIKVSDGRAGEGPSPFLMHFDHRDLGSDPMGHMIEDRHIRRALLDAMEAEPKVTRLSGETVTDHVPDTAGVAVTLANGQTLRGRVLIGADGRQSGTATR
ncbi:MAG: FAD-dependent monooxygenase, partial [Pseudomonadota bacterium]